MTKKNYEIEFPKLVSLAKELYLELRSHLEGEKYIDQIKYRVKDRDSFSKKAEKFDGVKKKYHTPLSEIEDQIGFRIVVKFLDEIPIAEKKLLKFYATTESTKREKPKPDSFGYESHHIIFVIPQKLREKHKVTVEYFEVQVCTIFQHAWAVGNHDIGYKPTNEESTEKTRKLAWVAANAWGADKLFQELKNS